MDFREIHCAWCDRKIGPPEDCIPCPRFRKLELQEDLVLDGSSFCGLCRNLDSADLKVFCSTNRRLQENADEPFDCYKFLLDTGKCESLKIHVVSVFLSHQGRICLVRRSRDARTYGGFWSAISGYLEGDPDKHFMTEVFEETMLAPDEYTLLRRAKTVVVPDRKEPLFWCVHPFLCEVGDPSRITLDRENSELRWISPREMEGFDTVPGLWKTYERVSMIPWEDETARFVRRIAEDPESDERQLARMSLHFLVRLLRSSNAAMSPVLTADLDYVCREISKARSSMHMIAERLGLLIPELHALEGVDVREALPQAAALIRKHIDRLDQTFGAEGHPLSSDGKKTKRRHRGVS